MPWYTVSKQMWLMNKCIDFVQKWIANTQIRKYLVGIHVFNEKYYRWSTNLASINICRNPQKYFKPVIHLKLEYMKTLIINSA